MRHFTAVVIFAVVAASLFLAVSCEDDGVLNLPSNLDPFSDEDAHALFLAVYNKVNYYATSGPNTYEDGSVTVSETRDNDIFNGYYSTDVTVVFDGFVTGITTIDRTAFVEAYMDVGGVTTAYGTTYTGTLKGTYDSQTYELTMNFTAENAAGIGITSSGTFTVNGKNYDVSVDSMYQTGF